MKNISHIATRIFDCPLMIQQAKLDAILAVLAQRIEGQPAKAAVLTDEQAKRKPYSVTKDGLAIISIVGPLVKRSSGDFLSGGPTTYGEIDNEFMDAATDPAIKGILLDIDSPGGEVGGLFELADMIHGQRGSKPIYAVANDDCFSAAYAIASAAERIYVTRAGGVGSIGVIAMHHDQSAFDGKFGVKHTTIFAGARKNDFNTHEPLSDAATESLQAEVNRLYGLFAAAVSRNRNLSVETVKATEAGLFFGQGALTAGLADREGSVQEAARDMLAAIQSNSRSLTPLAAGAAAKSKKEALVPDKEEVIETDTKPAAPLPVAEAVIAPKVDVAKLAAEAEQRGYALASEIAELCTIAGKPDMVAGFIKDRATMADVRKALITVRAEIDKREIQSRSTAVQGASGIAALETAAAELAHKNGISREKAYVELLDRNPLVYAQYIAERRAAATGGQVA